MKNEGLLQNAVFRPKRKIYLLKKLARTTTLMVLTNFFGDIIFENSILQQALLNVHAQTSTIFSIQSPHRILTFLVARTL